MQLHSVEGNHERLLLGNKIVRLFLRKIRSLMSRHFLQASYGWAETSQPTHLDSPDGILSPSACALSLSYWSHSWGQIWRLRERVTLSLLRGLCIWPVKRHEQIGGVNQRRVGRGGGNLKGSNLLLELRSPSGRQLSNQIILMYAVSYSSALMDSNRLFVFGDATPTILRVFFWGGGKIYENLSSHAVNVEVANSTSCVVHFVPKPNRATHE